MPAKIENTQTIMLKSMQQHAQGLSSPLNFLQLGTVDYDLVS
jgi:hypothetical protein